jgi:hypothetical protein
MVNQWIFAISIMPDVDFQMIDLALGKTIYLRVFDL